MSTASEEPLRFFLSSLDGIVTLRYNENDGNTIFYNHDKFKNE
jgi:hypothetical protein